MFFLSLIVRRLPDVSRVPIKKRVMKTRLMETRVMKMRISSASVRLP